MLLSLQKQFDFDWELIKFGYHFFTFDPLVLYTSCIYVHSIAMYMCDLW